jgi:hypothetical protein
MYVAPVEFEMMPPAIYEFEYVPMALVTKAPFGDDAFVRNTVPCDPIVTPLADPHTGQ